MPYDKNNVFAKIIRGEIPCRKICENEYAMSFYDINPCATLHVLIIPKGEYMQSYDFAARAGDEELAGFWRVFRETAEALGLKSDFNILSSAENGPFGRQSVPHFHLHLLSGRKLREDF